jgi:hypothetical protein
MQFIKLLDSRSFRTILWIVLAVEGAVAIWLSRPWVFGDNAHYLTLSDALARGHYGVMTAAGFEPDAIRPPGYPVLLWFFEHALGLPIAGIIVVQLVAYLFTLFLAMRLLGEHPLARPVLLLLAISYPAAMMYGLNIAAEAWTGLALIAIAVLIERGGRSPKILVLAGLIAGVAAYLRSDLLVVPVFLSAYLLCSELKAKAPPVRAIVRSALPSIAAAVLLLPYAVWNHSHFGRPLPTPAAGAVGTSLHLATWEDKLPQEDILAFYRGVATPKAEEVGLAREVRSINARLGTDELFAPWVPGNYPTNETRIAVTDITMDLAVQRIRAEPWNYVRHVGKNLWRLWQTGSYPASLPAFVVALLQLSSWLIFLLGGAGVILSFTQPRGWPLSGAPASILLAVPAVHIWLHTEARYTSSVRPLLLALATATILWLLRKYLSQTGDRIYRAANIPREQRN